MVLKLQTLQPVDAPWDDAASYPREACGVFGMVMTPRGTVTPPAGRTASEAHPGDAAQAAKSAFFALYALQHRGQESAGIAVMGPGGIRAHKGMGLVTQVFTERDLAPLVGDLAMGHVRYSTAGTSDLRNAQPYVVHTSAGPLALGHNGNLTNAKALREVLLARGVGLSSESDSELLTQLLAQPVDGEGAVQARGGDVWLARIEAMMRLAEGAYSLVLLTAEAVYAVRDPHGLRPLYLGRVERGEASAGGEGPEGYVVASESCAFGPIGAKLVREVEPGEIVRIARLGGNTTEAVSSVRPALPYHARAFCSFEYVYFARPDSQVEGQLVHVVRQRLGEVLAAEAPAQADLVVGVPDSALPAAMGYARASGIPYGEGLIKNRYIGRTFIQPTEALRKAGVRLKYNPLGDNLRGRRVVLVDDSIVRGTTAGPIVQLLRDGGATEVHVRISSPPVTHPCYMGVDMPRQEDLIASHLSPDEIARKIGADSCAFLSHAGMMSAIRAGLSGPAGAARGHCSACFSGRYPLVVRDLEDPVGSGGD
jgi:amidophosphoribosyltransferase